MCEILFLKQNAEKIKFSELAFENALFANSDGAGYLILEKSGADKWKLTDANNFPLNDTEELLKEKHFTDLEAEAEKKETEKEITETKPKKKLLLFDANFLSRDTEANKQAEADARLAEIEQEEYYTAYCGSYASKTPKIGYKNEYRTKWQKEKELEEKAEKMTEKEMDAIKTALIDELMTKQSALKENQAMITHFRIATSGKNGKSTQPIIYGDYAVIHNGIFKDIGDYDLSDTFQFTKMIHDKCQNIKKFNQKKEKATITRTLNGIGGSYSIFIYSWRTKRLYYYKSDFASFSWYNSKMEMGATSTNRFPNKHQRAVSTIIN